MKFRFPMTVAAAILGLALPAGAAQVSFDLQDFADAFADPFNGLSPGTITGGFTYDTSTAALSNIGIVGLLDTYLTGQVMRGTGFGFADAFFVFTAGANTLFFDLGGLDLDNPGLLPGQTQIFSNVFAFESANVTPEFQILDGTFFVGNVAATQAIAAVPLPASLPLLATVLGALGLAGLRRRLMQSARAAC